MNKLLMTGALFITGNSVKIIYDLITRPINIEMTFPTKYPLHSQFLL